jgi:hypothetical protein
LHGLSFAYFYGKAGMASDWEAAVKAVQLPPQSQEHTATLEAALSNQLGVLELLAQHAHLLLAHATTAARGFDEDPPAAVMYSGSWPQPSHGSDCTGVACSARDACSQLTKRARGCFEGDNEAESAHRTRVRPRPSRAAARAGCKRTSWPLKGSPAQKV